MIENKSDELSEQYRKEGNSNYSKKDHFNAIISFNKALCFAVSSENLAFAYANRSAMYFELKRYQKCLENIKWARENNYPAEKVQKLNDREEICKKMVDTGYDASEFIKLSYPANPKIPHIVECLEMRTTEEFGRGIYTTQDLKPGDIIAFDKPIFYSIKIAYQYFSCCICNKCQMQSLIPCLKSGSLMFCTVECRDKAYASYPDISCLLSLKGVNVNLARLLVQAEKAFNGHDNLMQYLKTDEYKNSQETIFDFDFSNPNDPDYEVNRMKAALSLISRDHDHYNDIVKSACKEVAKGNEYLEEFLKLICGIFVKKKIFFDTQITIPKTFSIGCLFNHSCLGNVTDSCNNNGTAVFHVTRPVKAGEQLFINYFTIKSLDSVLERQRILQEAYKFVCHCAYCVNNVNFDGVPSQVSMPVRNVLAKTVRFNSLYPLTSYKDLSVKLFKLLKEVQEMIIKNTDNLYSAEHFLLDYCNRKLLFMLGDLVNFPCEAGFSFS